MRKSKMSILVCCLMFLVVYVRPQETQIDFDGSSFRAVNIIELLKTDTINLGAFEMPIIVNAGEIKMNFDGANKEKTSLVETIKNVSEDSEILIPGVPARIYYGDTRTLYRVLPSAGNVGTEILGIIIKGTSKQEILKEILKQYFSVEPNKDDYVIGLIERSDTQILFNKENVYIRIKGSDTNLHEIKNRALVNTIKVILSETIPQNKQYCEFVKQVVMQLMWKKIGQIWTQVWVETVKLVKVCYDDNPPNNSSGGSGSTWHHGQGGDSNYDVNKRINIYLFPVYGCTITSDYNQLCE